MDEHTKGILSQNDLHPKEVMDNARRWFASVNSPEDARRLVACWNFCERATTEELEANQLATTVDAIGTVPHFYVESIDSPDS